MTELPEGEAELDAGEGRRGPMRGLVWLTVKRGAVRLMGVGALRLNTAPSVRRIS